MESIIYENQQEYYSAISASNDVGESTAFIEFMLSFIKATLIEALGMSDGMSDAAQNKSVIRWSKIEDYLKHISSS